MEQSIQYRAEHSYYSMLGVPLGTVDVNIFQKPTAGFNPLWSGQNSRTFSGLWSFTRSWTFKEQSLNSRPYRRFRIISTIFGLENIIYNMLQNQNHVRYG